jgi:hypothetical protein
LVGRKRRRDIWLLIALSYRLHRRSYRVGGVLNPSDGMAFSLDDVEVLGKGNSYQASKRYAAKAERHFGLFFLVKSVSRDG